MTASDEWGKDPSVKAMRRVFRAMEEAQNRFLDLLRISPLDPRLRSWREKARIAFESAWGRAVRLGLNMQEKEAGALYTHCLGKMLEEDGVELPEEFRTTYETFGHLFKEDLR